MEKIIDLLTRISELYNIPQWLVNTGAITIFCILVAFPFVVRHLMQPKYYRFRELILFKVLWRWKYKKGDVVGLWCYCPKCQAMLMVDDENCRSNESLQDKVTYFICNKCGGNELGRVVGGDRRYALSLVKRDLWRHIKEGTFNEVSTATKEALEIYQKIEASKKNECETCTDETALSEIEEPLNTEVQEEDEKKEEPKSTETALHVKEDVIENELKEDIKKDGI